MRAEYTIGVCFDNNDPQSLGRIRAIPLEVLGKLANLKDILIYINKTDSLAVEQTIYKPWSFSNTEEFKERDRFLCEPFLPKTLGITPNPGQLVKIITYNNFNEKTEFIGPYTIDQISLTEEYRNVVNNLQKTINIKDVLPRIGKNFISGYNNEQLIMGNNEVILRLDHINSGVKTKKNSYPFIQLSQFDNSYNVKERTETITETPDVPIDHICELFLDYKPKDTILDQNFRATLLLYDTSQVFNVRGELGLTKDTYDNTNQYINKISNNYVVKHVVTSSSYGDFVKVIDEILISYKNGIVKYIDVNLPNNTQFIEAETTNITIENNIPNSPNIGGAINPINIVPNLRNWVFRLTPNTNLSDYEGNLLETDSNPNSIIFIRNNDYTNLNTLINKFRTEILNGSLAINNTVTSTITRPTPESTGNPQSVYTSYCDKYLFLSSLNSLNLIDSVNYDGIPSDKIAEFFGGFNQNVRTYGFIRGEKLLELLLEILDMFTKHGHEIGVDPRGSIIQSTQEAVEGLKKRLTDELKENRNNIIINHNFRLN